MVHRELVSGDTVMNERTDCLLFEGQWIEIPIAGVFVVRDGKIRIWRDYFDLNTLKTQLSPATIRSSDNDA